MDGTYISTIQTPMGTMQGKITLISNGQSLSGSIEAMGMKSSFTNGSINRNTCKFSGVIQSFLGNITYNATGEVSHDILKITADTNKGKFEFSGKKQ